LPNFHRRLLSDGGGIYTTPPPREEIVAGEIDRDLIASISISLYQLSMGQIMIRNIDAAVIQALRRRASACGTSLEEQARRALAKAVGLDREAAARRLTEIRRSIGRLGGPSTLDDLRRDRDRDKG
jgi:plasmid stability protein